MNLINELNSVITEHQKGKEISLRDRELVMLMLMSSFAIVMNNKNPFTTGNYTGLESSVITGNVLLRTEPCIGEIKVFDKIKYRTKLSAKGKSSYGPQRR